MMVSILSIPQASKNASDQERQRLIKMYQDRITHASVETKLVKLADRLDNTREAADLLDKAFQQRMLDEGKGFYLPLAETTDSYLYEELGIALENLEKNIKFG